jgi:chemotaxis family two-component system response regulator Rcp1
MKQWHIQGGAHMIEILMVDDDEGDVLMTQEALEIARFENNFHAVHDGLEALDFMKKEGRFSGCLTPDLVLLDLNMPRMDGHEIWSWMRTHKQYKLTPVVILTTSSSEKDVLKSYQEQASCFITKPVDLEQFNKTIKAIDDFWTSIVRLPPKTKM